MKSCPTCNRTFEDTLTFCLADGSLLSAPFDPQATQRIPAPRNTEPPPTEVMHAAASSYPPPIQPAWQANYVAPTMPRPAPYAGGQPFGAHALPARRGVAWHVHLLAMIVGLVIGLLLRYTTFLRFFILTNSGAFSLTLFVFLSYGIIGIVFGYKWPQKRWKWGVWIVGLHWPVILVLSAPYLRYIRYWWWIALANFVLAPLGACIGSHLAAKLSLKRMRRAF